MTPRAPGGQERLMDPVDVVKHLGRVHNNAQNGSETHWWRDVARLC
jgi:hypothetical protein